MIGLRRTSIALAVAWIGGMTGCSGGEQQQGAHDAVAVSVNALSPANSLPPPQTTNEDSQLTFSTFAGNPISVSDGDNTTSTVQITVTNGVFFVGSTVNGITVTGNGTASVILSGPIALFTTGMLTGGINKALDGARYTPAANFNGAATLQMNSSDTNGEVGFNVLDITVTSFNDSPVNNAPTGTQAATEDVPQAFTLSVNDVDVGNAPMVVSLSSSNNTLITLSTLSGLSFSSGDGTADAALSFSGTLSNINAALNGLTVTPSANYIGPSTLVITSNDQGASGSGASGSDTDTVNIEWAAVNDPPVNGLPAAQATIEESAVTFSAGNGNALSVNDADGPTTLVQVTLSATFGTISLGAPGGVTFTAGDGTADASMTFRGTLFSLNTAMANTVFTPSQDYAGNAVLTMISNDLGNIGSGGARQDTDTLNISVAGVNDPPVNNVPGSQITAEDVVEVFSTGNGSAISFADPDAATLQVTLTAQNGTVTLGALTGLTFQTGDGTADAVMSFTGATASVNAAVNALSFRPALNFGGEASLTVQTSDRGATGTGGTLTDEDVIVIEVVAGNDPPDAVNDTLTVAEDADLTHVAVLGNDTGAPDVGETLSITAVSTPLHGTSSIDGSEVTYQPAANYAGADSFTYTISDGNGGSDTASVAITVTGSNDAPSAQPDSFTVLQDSATTLSVLSNDSVAPDSGETLHVTLVGMPTHGTATITGGGASISYSSSTGYTGSDSFTYTISDGNGGTDSADVAISVQAVNTKPVNTLPGPQTVSEDSQLPFSSTGGNAITVADTNNATLTVQVSVTNGTFTLGAVANLSVTGNGTASVAAQGTLAALNNGLNNARYTPSPSYNGPATLTLNSADSSGESDLDVLTLSVTSINDAPVNSVPVGVQAAVEDVPQTFGTISISDPDVGSGQLLVTLTADNGTRITLSSVAGLSFSVGDGQNDPSMTFTGALPSINTALNGLTITATSNYIGTSSLSMTTSDQGGSGVGGPGQDSDSISISWVSVNDPPVNSVPGAQAADEESPFTFALASGNALRVSDLDVSGGLMQVTLSVSTGSVSLGITNALTFSSGDGTADVSMTFTGTLANINNALEGTVFTPSANFAGAATLTLVSSDLGNSGSGGTKTDTDTVTVNVAGRNDAPVNTVPGAQLTNEDVARVFSSANGNALSVADVDASSLQLSLSATSGTLTLGVRTGLTFQAGDGIADGSMTFTGTLASVNAALNGLSYLPALNFNGMTLLTVLTSDLGASGTGGTRTDEDSITVSVTAVNDPPDAVNDTLTLDEDSAPTSVTVLANDSALPDTSESLSITAVTTPAHGSAMINGSQITYQPAANYQGTDSFTYTIADGSGGADTATVAVTVLSVNDSPTAAADSFAVLQNSGANPLGVLSNDSSAPDSGETVSIIGVTAPSNGATNITGGGSGLTYTPNAGYTGSDSFTYTISDGNGGTSLATVAMTVTAVNTRPVNTLPLPQTTSEDVALFFSSVAGNPITVADSNNATLSIQISVTNGIFTLGGTTGLTVTFNGSASVTAQGTIAALNTGLNNSRYLPNTNYSGASTLTITTSDTNGESDLDVLTLNVASVNDAPVNVVPSGTQAATEDLPKTFSNISITDVDIGSGVLSVDLSADNGTLITLGTASGLLFSEGDGTADALMAFTGTLPAINTALNALSISAPANFLGATSFTIVTNDLGNTGAGGARQDSETINLTWASVNDPPINSVPGEQITLEENALLFSSAGAAISVSDADIGGGFMRVTFSSTNGTVSLGNPGLVTYTVGDGTADATMTFAGTLANVNSALDGATFTPTLNYVGAAVVTVASNDQGNTGGAAQADTDTIAVTVLPVNDAPVNTVPIAQTTNEEVTRIFSSANGNPITVADLDATSLQITLSAENATLTLGALTGLSFQAGDGTADASMTFTAPIAALNTALSGLRFIPTPNFNGIGKLTIQTNDLGVNGLGGARFDEDAIEINVTSINDAPDAIADALTVSEDAAPQLIAVLANDTDAPDSGETLLITAVSAPLHGTASTDGETVTYQPTANYGGADSFTYTISDGNGGSDTATVSVTVIPVNDAPDAVDDALQVAEGAIDQALNVLANDTIVPDSGETLTITVVTAPGHGMLEIASGGASVLYSPTFGYFGPDSFTYTVSDGNAATDTATVTLEVTSVDTQPAPTADVLNVDEDASGVADVLANDSGLSDLPLVVTIATQPAHGTLSVQLDNTLLYTPAPDYAGADAFTYTVTDLDGDTANGDVTVNVAQLDDLPEAVADTATTEEDTEVEIAVLDNDNRLVDMPVVVSIETEPEHGEATANDDGTITYVPEADYNGDDELQYAVTDATGSVVQAVVSLAVTPVNDAPVAKADTATTDPGVPVVIAVLDNDSDVDGDELSLDEISEGELGGTVVINADGTLRYTPPLGLIDATDTLTYTVIDSEGASDTGMVVISVGIDTDGDGLIDADERELGTDPLKPDSDGDLIPDGIEIKTTDTDPLDDDSDDDGLLDGHEDVDQDGAVGESETDPHEVDTDGDGVQDGTESGLSEPEGDDTDLAVFVPDADPTSTTDPVVADTDGDGIPDGEEDANGDGQVGSGESDPEDDSDGTGNDEPDAGVDGGGGSDAPDCEQDSCPPDGGIVSVTAPEASGCRAAGGATTSSDPLLLALACATLWLRRRRRA